MEKRVQTILDLIGGLSTDEFRELITLAWPGCADITKMDDETFNELLEKLHKLLKEKGYNK